MANREVDGDRVVDLLAQIGASGVLFATSVHNWARKTEWPVVATL